MNLEKRYSMTFTEGQKGVMRSCVAESISKVNGNHKSGQYLAELTNAYSDLSQVGNEPTRLTFSESGVEALIFSIERDQRQVCECEDAMLNQIIAGLHTYADL